MRVETKTILFYVLCVAGLVAATTLFNVDNDSEIAANIKITDTPTRAATPTATKQRPTRVSIQAGPLGCITTPWGGRDGYRPAAPFTTTLAPPGATENLMTVSGTVYAADCVTPLPGVRLEVWHADANGHYPASRFRGQMITDAEGRYKFTTIKPSRYVTFNEFVPAHIHYLVHYPNTPLLATYLFFEGDPFLGVHLASSAQRRLARPITTRIGPEAPVFQTTFDIVLATDPPN